VVADDEVGRKNLQRSEPRSVTVPESSELDVNDFGDSDGWVNDDEYVNVHL
jgi:hypothetical protein